MGPMAEQDKLQARQLRIRENAIFSISANHKTTRLHVNSGILIHIATCKR